MMINLIINPESVRLSKSKTSEQIFSEIYFHICDGVFFPEEKWDDFSVIIMGWWLEKGLQIRDGNGVTFNFMDGPYSFEVSKLNESFVIHFITNRREGKIILHREEVNGKSFLKLLLKNANLLIRSLPDEATKLSDVSNLINNFKLLQRHVRSIY